MSATVTLEVQLLDRDAPMLSRRSAEIATMLGVTRADLGPAAERSGQPLRIPIAPGSITLITGPSGSGKSTLLRAITQAARAERICVITPPTRLPTHRPCCDLVGHSASASMRVLASAGLADVRAMVRTPAHLSDGQRSRLRIAIALGRAASMARSERPVVVAIDEFAANLDAITAMGLAMALRRRAAERGNVAFVIASPREDTVGPLDPDMMVALDACEPPTLAPRHRSAVPMAMRIRRGSRADYEALAPLHYRPGHPATMDLILCAVDARSGIRAGVLVVSRPTLNAGWREMAWPGRFAAGAPDAAARRINRELRCISRVIVDPRFRSLGVAERLVRTYLRRPLSRCTEALAAMGHASPDGGFFARAGMTAYHLPVPLADARLADALDHAAIDAWRMADPEMLARRAMGTDVAGFLEHELRVWAARRAPAMRESPLLAILCRASRTIGATPMAYAHTARLDVPRRCA